MKQQKPFAFAGLWDSWQKKGEPPLYSCTIITTEANDFLKAIHPRMPVIIGVEDYNNWLDEEIEDTEKLNHFLKPYDQEEMVYYPVSRTVNSPANDVPECIKAV